MDTMKEDTVKDGMVAVPAVLPATTARAVVAAASPTRVTPRRAKGGSIVWAVGRHPLSDARPAAATESRAGAKSRGPAGAGELAQAGVWARALGSVLVARSESGVCAILLGEDKALLMAELARYFPDATLQESAASLADLLADWWTFLDTPAQGFNHPLDLAGTPLQQQVWETLREIPPGATLTYTDLAARIGRPQAARAVASACAANRLAVVIPCHRVIGRSGSLTGYRWGIDRKRSLLAMEARV